MDYEIILQIVSTIGVPSAVAGYLLIKVQKTQEEILKTLTELAVIIHELKNNKEDE